VLRAIREAIERAELTHADSVPRRRRRRITAAPTTPAANRLAPLRLAPVKSASSNHAWSRMARSSFAPINFVLFIRAARKFAPDGIDAALVTAGGKQTDAALADFNRALELNPNLSGAYTARGYIYRERGDVQRALAEFTRSIQVEPNVEAYYERGQTYESLGDHQKAIPDLDEAIAMMRDAPYIYRARALVKLKLGDTAGYQEDHAMARKFEHY